MMCFDMIGYCRTASTMPLVDDFPALLLVEDRTIQHLILLADELKTGTKQSSNKDCLLVVEVLADQLFSRCEL